jgi:hypothetical protein
MLLTLACAQQCCSDCGCVNGSCAVVEGGSTCDSVSYAFAFCDLGTDLVRAHVTASEGLGQNLFPFAVIDGFDSLERFKAGGCMNFTKNTTCYDSEFPFLPSQGRFVAMR